MATSISVREIQKFEIPEGKIEVKKANVPLGTITKSHETYNVSGITFEIFKCTFSKDISDQISVYVNELDDYKEFTTYKKQFKFTMYYSSKKNLLFSDSITPVTKAFLRALATTENVILEYKTVHFDLDDISERFDQTKGIRFSSNDEGVNAKSLSGYQVDINPEASTALQNDDATQVIGVMDVGASQYTIMLTQSGTIMSFSKLLRFDTLEAPMLSFAIEVLKKINYLN